MRVPLPLLAASLALPALPGTAAADAPGPYCAVALVDAAAGESKGCATLPGSQVLGETWRSMTFAVSNGIVTAELGCGGDPVLREFRTVAGPGRATATIPRDAWCWLILTAVTDGASAAGESHAVVVMK